MNAVTSKAQRHDYRNIINGIAWLAKTVLMAALSPYALIALFLALATLFGMSSSDVHEIIVSMATRDAKSWAYTSTVWHDASLLCYVVVTFIRVHTSEPVQSFYDKLEASINARVEPMFTWLDTKILRKPRHRKVITALMVMVIVGGTAFLATQPSRPPLDLNRKPFSADKPLNYPTAAAITFADGSITSGKATVTKQADGKYVVTFTN